MAESNRLSFVPRWAQDLPNEEDFLDDEPFIGQQPLLVPHLPTRLVPSNGYTGISVATLKDTLECTQRILNYSSYEAVHGVNPLFSDLRSAGSDVLRIAQMTIEPFEEGSFVIPATFSEAEIEADGQRFSADDVLDRFAAVLENIGNPHFPASIGVVQAVEELGRIVRRDVEFIEYIPRSSRPAGQSMRPLVVDRDYASRVSKSKEERQRVRNVLDSMAGTIVAVDLEHASFSIRGHDRNTIKGIFEALTEERIVRLLGQSVQVHGVIQYRHDKPTFIRAFWIEETEEPDR